MAQDPNEAKAEEKQSSTNVLMVLTNCNKIVDKEGKELNQTGWYIPEVAHPYAIFKAAGYGMTFASIKGGECECDFSSYKDWCLKENPDKECVEFLDLIRASDKNEACTDDERKKAVDNVKGSIGRDESGDAKDRKINKIVLNTISFTGLQGKSSNYDIVFFCGGHGTCWDFVDSNPKHDKPAKKDTRDMHAFAAQVYENKDKPGVVAAVCHGPLALVDLLLSDGTALVKDKTVTGFTNKEEEAVKLNGVVPVLLEDGLKKNGGKFVGADNWKEHAVADSGVVTGQNPNSASKTAKLCVEELAKRRKK